MANSRVRLSVFLAVCLLGARMVIAQERGSIRGIVVDERGVPTSAVKVNVDRADGRKRGSLIRYVETDSEGHFVVDRLEWGLYKIFTLKEDAAYPNMRASFYSNDVFPSATISRTAPEAHVRIQLGPKAGVLTGSVTDALNGAPVNSTFRLTRATSPNKWISTSVPPDYRLLLPSSTDVLLEVSALGYETWYFGGPSDLSRRPPMRLESGSQMHLDVHMVRAHDNSVHPSKFLVPEGYVGWVLLEYNVKDAPAVPVENEVKVFIFPKVGSLNTSSPGPEEGAENEYFYYAEDGSMHEIPTDYRNGKGMVWGEYQGSKGGIMSLVGFFVGSKEQYKKYQSQAGHPGQIPLP